MMYKEDLDHMTSGGCGKGTCGHKHETLYLHGRCHIQARIVVHCVNEHTAVQALCGICQKTVAVIAAKPAEAERGLDLVCHKDAQLSVRYTNGAGFLELLCGECENLLTMIPVRSAKEVAS